ncbi:MAG: hypothetical protein AAB217_09835 [Chloroflexota bacterium]
MNFSRVDERCFGAKAGWPAESLNPWRNLPGFFFKPRHQEQLSESRPAPLIYQSSLKGK